MKKVWGFFTITLLLVLMMCLSLPMLGAVPQVDPRAVLAGQTLILHTNDTHGRIVEEGKAGISAISALKKLYESRGAEVLLLDAGDTLQGLPFAILDKGASVAKLMDLAGYEAMTPGNHDFSYGFEYLLNLSKTAEFKILSANTLLKKTDQPAFSQYRILEKNGKKFGIFGLTTPETAIKTNPTHVVAVTFADPIRTAQAMVTKLQSEKVDYIVALGHLGVDAGSEFTSEKLLAQVEGIDIFIDGHSHTAFFQGKVCGETLLASTGEYCQNIGVITIKEDGSKSAQLITKEEVKGLRDPAIDAQIAKIQTQSVPLLNKVVGKTAVDLDGERTTNRAQETNLGNLTADAIRWGTKADVAMNNGGAIRASIKAGDITKGQITEVFPFGNYVATKYIPGKVIQEVLEHSVRLAPELNGGFMQVSGLSFTYDPSKAAGSRVSDLRIGGTPPAPDKAYLFATNDFLIAGGDGYEMLKPYPIVNEFPSLEEMVINYISTGIDLKPEVEGRIKTTMQAAKIYVVLDGDCLWKIAQSQLGDKSAWKQIYRINQDTLSDPNRIFAGQRIKLPK